TLRGLYGADVTGSLTFDPVWALSALAITFAGTALAGAQALWTVVRLPLLASARPRAWARASAVQIRIQLGAACALLAVATVAAVYGSSLVAGFACLAALLLGAALALPAFLLTMLGALARLVRGVMSEWLVADARQQVPALSLALMALLLALAANIGVGTMVGAFRGTFVGWLDQRLASELYVTARSAEEAAAMQTYLADRADAVLPIWSVEGRAADQAADIFGIKDHPTYRNHWPLLAQTPDAWDRVAASQGALINEQLARRADLWPGSELRLGPEWTLPVVGVYSDYGNPRAQVITSFDHLRARYPDAPILRYAVRTDPNTVEALRRDLSAAFDLPASSTINQDEVKAFSLRVFDQTFVVTAALNVLTLGIAALAMLTSLLTLAQMRLPQIAPVWALGHTPRQIAGMELARAGLLACLTFVMALPLGLALAWVLLAIVNVQAFGWRIPMQIFPADWLRLGGLALLAALLAALWPAWRVLRLPPARLLGSFASDR
ncbi:MAG: ABC transporter permease, partial [Rhodobacteraceae bacterium]|nr:ABC transporter permease [Paracoccaceae bacterium]